MVAEADKVAVRFRLTGTRSGSFAVHPPTGRRVAWSSFRIYRLVDGKVIQTWAMQDRLGLLQQLGVVAPTDRINWAGGPPSPTKP